jgi:ABC-type branched-subunit amino acid transport system ATPase component
MSDRPVLALVGASKSYGAVHALRDGNIELRAGEVRALVGENGAGKSTLVKLLGGVIRLDDGRMLVEGEPVDFHSPTAARDAGIAVIYQEPTLFGDLSVAENVVMGRHPLGALRRIDRRAMDREVQGLLDRLGVRLDAERPVRGLSIADQQIVEIAKALSFDARVLIMADRCAVGPGSRAAVRRRAHAAGARRRGAVHLAPPRGGVRDLRHDHRDARRRRRARRPDRRHDHRRGRAPDGGPRPRRAVPQGGRGDRRAGPGRPPPHARGRLHRRELRVRL